MKACADRIVGVGTMRKAMKAGMISTDNSRASWPQNYWGLLSGSEGPWDWKSQITHRHTHALTHTLGMFSKSLEESKWSSRR